MEYTVRYILLVVLELSVLPVDVKVMVPAWPMLPVDVETAQDPIGMTRHCYLLEQEAHLSAPMVAAGPVVCCHLMAVQTRH